MQVGRTERLPNQKNDLHRKANSARVKLLIYPKTLFVEEPPRQRRFFMSWL